MSTFEKPNSTTSSSSPDNANYALTNLFFTITTADAPSSEDTRPSSPKRPEASTSSGQSSVELSSIPSKTNPSSEPSEATQEARSQKSSLFSRLFRSKNEELRALETKFKEIYPHGEISATRFGLRFTADKNDLNSPSFSHTRYRGPVAWAGIHTATALLGYAAYGLYLAAPPFGLLTCAGICAAGWLCTTRPSAEYKLTSRMISNCLGARANTRSDPKGALWAHTKADLLASWLVTTSSASWSGQFSLNPFIMGELGNDLKTQVINPLSDALNQIKDSMQHGGLADFANQSLHDQAIQKAQTNWKEFEGAFMRKYETQEMLFRSIGGLTGVFGGLGLFA